MKSIQTDYMKVDKKMNLLRGMVDLRLLIVLLFGLTAAVFVGTVVGSGDFKEAYIYVLLIVGVGVMATMHRSYWMLIPFAMVGDFPAVPLGPVSMKLGEAWLLVSMVFMVIQAVHRRRLPTLFRMEALPVFLYTGWAFVIYLLNPVGLSSMGASSGGLRFYVMIGLSLVAIIILMNQTIDQAKAKKVLVLILLGAFLGSVWNIGWVLLFGDISDGGISTGDGGGFYGWSQQLVTVPHILVIYLVSRYSVKMLLHPRNWWAIGLFLVCIVIGFLSGKRSLTMLMLLYPIIGAMMRREWGAVFLGGCLASLIISGAVMAHGPGFELPKTAQRVLSIIPFISEREWDGDVQASASGGFRETLNKYALREIEERPILGEGLEADFDLLWQLRYDPGEAFEEDDHFLGLTYKANSNWHNTWLGISADFGIPAAVIWAMIWVCLIVGCRNAMKGLSVFDWRYTLLMFILLWTLGDLLRSWQFGHSAINIWQVAWRVGVWLAVKQSLQNAMEDGEEQPSERNRAEGELSN